MLNNFLPNGLLHQNLSVGDHGEDSIELSTCLRGVFLLESFLQESLYTTFDCQLHISKLFINLMPEDFSEQKDLMILGLKGLDRVDDGLSLIDDDWL